MSDARAWVVLAIVALLPFGAAAEVPILVAALWALASLRTRDARAPGVRLALVLFGAYWVPELLSAPDSLDARKSWLEVAADLRFGLLLLFATQVVRVRLLTTGVAVILLAWCVDALVQAATGYSLGGPARLDRLSGIFGDGNLKLGGVVAVLAPFALLWAAPLPTRDAAGNDVPRNPPPPARGERPRWARAMLAFLLLLVVILLAGARAALIGFGVAVVLVALRRLGAKRAALALSALLAVAVLAVFAARDLSPRFAERMARTSQALHGDPAALDYALSFRLPIWRTALDMARAHPVNGVGVRAFNEAYAGYAAPGDHWLDPNHGSGALHAHQLLLEVLSETGVLGLICWLTGVAAAWQAWRRAGPPARERAAAPAFARAAMLFPRKTQ
jgi:O-antigen ligase